MLKPSQARSLGDFLHSGGTFVRLMPTWWNSRKFKRWSTWVVVACFLAAIPRLASLRDVGEKLRHADLALVLLALCMNYTSLWLQSVRWRVLLVRSEVGVGRLFAVNLVGVASGFLLPAAAAGDLVKSTILARTEGFADSILSTAVGRLVGMVAVGIVCMLGFLLWRTPGNVVETWRLALFLALSAVGIVMLYKGGAACRAMLSRFPRLSAKSWIRKPVEYLELLGTDPRRLTKALALSIAQQSVLIVSGWALFHAAGSDIGFAPVLAMMPLIQLGTLIPVSAGGVGMREGFTVGLFCGIARLMARDVCLASIALGYLVLVVQVLSGGAAWLFLFRAPRRTQPAQSE